MTGCNYIITLLILLFFIPGVGFSQDDDKDSRIGISFLSLHPLNLWSETPNPEFDVLALGLNLEGKVMEMMLGYISLRSHPDYQQGLFFGAGYYFIKEEKTRIGLGVLTEFNLDENFEIPADPSITIYEISSTLTFGVQTVGNLWVYIDIYLYKLHFSRNEITGVPFYENSIPLLTRLVYKF